MKRNREKEFSAKTFQFEKNCDVADLYKDQ